MRQRTSILLIVILVALISAAQVLAQKKEDCGCEAKNTPADTVAIANGVKLSMKDLDELIKDRVREAQNQVIEARSRELYLMINSKLLEAESKKQNLSPTKLIEQEVLAKVKEPTEAEARTFYDENKSRIRGEFSEVKDQITAYLRNQRQQEQAKHLADRLRAAAEIKMLVERARAPETEADRAEVLAVVNKENITSADVEESLKPLIFDVQKEVYRLRKDELELKINDILLEQESQKRKTTARALVESEVTSKVKKISEEDAKKFYDENKDRAGGDFAQMKGQLITYLQQLEQRKAEAAFAERLRKAATVEIYLKAPEPLKNQAGK